MRLPPQRIVVSVLDQVVSSLTNVLLSIAVARVASPEVYAQVAIAVTTMLALLTVTRQSVGAYLVSLGGAPRRLRESRVAAALGVQAVLAPLAAVAPCVLLVVAPGTGAGGVLIALAVVGPLVLVQDALRYVATSRRRPGAALLSDSVWLVVFLAAWPLGARTGDRPLSLVVAWGLGALAGYVVLLVATGGRPAFRPLPGWWIQTRPAFTRLLGDGVAAAAVPLGIVAIIGVGLPLTQSGAYLATALLFGPVNVLLTVLSLVVSTEAEGVQNRRRAARLFGWVGAGSAVAVAVYALALVLMPDSWGEALLGPTWTASSRVLPARAADGMGIALLAVLYGYHRWLRRYDLQLWFRAGQAVGSLVAAVVACLWLGTAVAVAASTAGTIAVVLLVSAFLRPGRDGSRRGDVGAEVTLPEGAR
jgi:hypothetical protein